jgi:hypothetical protein
MEGSDCLVLKETLMVNLINAETLVCPAHMHYLHLKLLGAY